MKRKSFALNAQQFSAVAYRWVAEKKIDCVNNFTPCYRNITYAKEDCRECISSYKKEVT